MAIDQMLGMGNMMQSFNPLSSITNAVQGLGTVASGVLSLDPGAIMQGLTQTITGQGPTEGAGQMEGMDGMDSGDDMSDAIGMRKELDMAPSRSANALLQREIQKLNL
jgi:hypothetical protein